jgi:hypothetical protein
MFTAAAIAAASLSLTAAPALAKGGGGGGGQAAPAPAPAPAPSSDGTWTLCPDYASTGFSFAADGSTLFANEIPGVACLIARSSLNGTLSIAEIRLGTGWTSNVKSAGGGSSNKIDVEVDNRATGKSYEFVIAPGKTVIR